MAFDMEAYEVVWKNQITVVFNSSSNTQEQNTGIGCIRNELIELHRMHTRLWWNVKSLEEYVKHQIVPQGLRVQIFPAWEVAEAFEDTWESGLSQCSKIIMSMLIEHDRDLLAETKLN